MSNSQTFDVEDKYSISLIQQAKKQGKNLHFAMLREMIEKHNLQPHSPLSVRKDSNSSEKKNSGRKHISSLNVNSKQVSGINFEI